MQLFQYNKRFTKTPDIIEIILDTLGVSITDVTSLPILFNSNLWSIEDELRFVLSTIVVIVCCDFTSEQSSVNIM